MASYIINKEWEEVLSYLATVFLLVTLFGKQLVSQEALVEVQRQFQGHGIEETREASFGMGCCCHQLS